MQLILARLLVPADYGIVALVFVFIAIANIFVQGGIGTSLIQKKEIDSSDVTSVFYLSLLISLVLYFALFLLAPIIAQFYSNIILTKIIRILSLSLIIGSFNTIQTALLSRNMQFKTLFICNTSATILSGILGIIFAYLGYGVWSLVIQQLSRRIGISIVLFIVVKWRPSFNVSLKKIKELYSFGWKLMVANLISTIYTNLRGLIIGKKFSTETLGYYDKGTNFPYFIITNISGSIQSVLFPTLASNQESLVKVKSITRRAVKTSSFVVFPIMAGLIALSEPIVLLILTDKWLKAVPFIKLLSVSYAMIPIMDANLQALNAIGRSDLFLKIEIYKRSLGLLILFISLLFGIYGIVIGEVVAEFLALLVAMYPSKIIFNYSFKEQIHDILQPLILSIFMGLIIYLFNFLKIVLLLKILLQILIGALIYFSLAWLLKFESFIYLLEIVLPFLNRKNKEVL